MLFALTPRRTEALATLRRLAAEAGGAVHYSLVAAGMRISAWTAYDLLLELEKLGLVARRYAPAPGQAGRSRILFMPAAAPPASGDETALAAAFERFAAIPDEAAAARAYLSASSTDLAYHLGYWLARLVATGRETADAARGVLEGGGAPLQKAQTVVAMGLGAALARLGRARRLASRVTAASAMLSARLDDAARTATADLADLVDASRRLELS